jgi:hemin uptake protein HemP
MTAPAHRPLPRPPAPVGTPPAGPAALHPVPPVPVHDARRLTGGGALAAILLDGQCYTLRITRAGKLILTK